MTVLIDAILTCDFLRATFPSYYNIVFIWSKSHYLRGLVDWFTFFSRIL